MITKESLKVKNMESEIKKIPMYLNEAFKNYESPLLKIIKVKEK
jgi:hypothetical protein